MRHATVRSVATEIRRGLPRALAIAAVLAGHAALAQPAATNPSTTQSTPHQPLPAEIEAALARARLPELRMVLVAGPRIDPGSLAAPAGVEVRAFVPDLDRHLAACDLALVQGGLTTCMELAAAGTPFLYFPLRNHFEQNFHVAHRLERYGAGRRMAFATSTPEVIAEAMVDTLRTPTRFRPVEADGAQRAARMLVELL